MVKAIITDLDRTLLTTAKKLSEKTTNIFRQVKYASKLQLDAVTTLHGARTYVGRDTIKYSNATEFCENYIEPSGSDSWWETVVVDCFPDLPPDCGGGQ